MSERDANGYLDVVEVPVRFSDKNERLCDYARPDDQAGLHKHVLNSLETNGLNHCMACGRDWEER